MVLPQIALINIEREEEEEEEKRKKRRGRDIN